MNYSTAEGTQGICPAGSHIPSDENWKTLEIYLGMSQGDADLNEELRGTDQGAQIISGGASGLDFPSAGIRLDGPYSGEFSGEFSGVYAWSSTHHYYRWAYARWVMTLSSAKVFRWDPAVEVGLSVRCLGD
ncbi:hypothetical protein CVV43_04250 [Candidatus Saccharibacteria bacterium HGW-Saccharibacteria-1]|jgi:uncharacterized protein (TIGR02145 family)|nr:MAG: hypothetical protein CVV43_04250 [Candidatus Saccharibacteria bacterium HGW-Saccharibacteria-1]